jgi:hypothetical protein
MFVCHTLLVSKLKTSVERRTPWSTTISIHVLWYIAYLIGLRVHLLQREICCFKANRPVETFQGVKILLHHVSLNIHLIGKCPQIKAADF